MTTELLARARAGDEEAFRQLVEPHRHELQVHCYRVLGSLADAEDLLQDTLLAAWQGLAGFEERASLRKWLYRIATNRCLNWMPGPSQTATSTGWAARCASTRLPRTELATWLLVVSANHGVIRGRAGL